MYKIYFFCFLQKYIIIYIYIIYNISFDRTQRTTTRRIKNHNMCITAFRSRAAELRIYIYICICIYECANTNTLLYVRRTSSIFRTIT